MATACDPAVQVDHWLRPLATQRKALVPVDRLPDLWRLSKDEALDLAAELVQEGWLATWDPPDADSCVICSNRGADLLGVELEPPDSDDLAACRWVPRGTSTPLRPRSRECLECDLPAPAIEGAGWLDSLPDDLAVDPAEAAEALDDPYPLPKSWRPGWSPDRAFIILGTRPIWPVHREATEACPGCGSVKLRRGWACLLCDRIGGILDPSPEEIPSPDRKPCENAGSLAGGRGQSKPGRVRFVEPARPKKRRRRARG